MIVKKVAVLCLLQNRDSGNISKVGEEGNKRSER